ncbi:helix-turn-helix domain-containing protein [Umezawaea endophytica]|uniref:Helix-turn-helix domain-containing protein n=1 Tax=Umezawaea endophytica TaxID=1654476 RepID=A0A9X2VNG4_9PSEU|nr:helix-turn-helix transcriptional regulator [Umezawaea endophytica]MCS7479735.1 helix-turn-helix domain-containing protein [Umezawaea endophytica]
MEYSIPAIRRLQLGRTLRNLRKAAGLTVDQVGPDLDMSASTLNRMENGRGRVHPLVVRGALDLFETPFDQVEEVMALAREAYRNTWWMLQGIKANSYPALESEAASVRNFELALIPGIFQIEDYATALFTLDTERDRNRNLVIRMNRMARLTDERPLIVHAVIDETALHRSIGGPAVQKAQLRHLIALSELPNVTIQVLPCTVGSNRGLRGAFSVLAFPPNTIDELGYLDHAAGNLQLASAPKVKELRLRFDSIASLALNEGDSVALLTRFANG